MTRLQRAVVGRFANRIGEDAPGVGDEFEGLVGEGEAVDGGVEEESEPAVLSRDVLGALSQPPETEDGVPVGEVGGGYADLSGDEDVADREDVVGGFGSGRVGFAGADREGFGSVEVGGRE